MALLTRVSGRMDVGLCPISNTACSLMAKLTHDSLLRSSLNAKAYSERRLSSKDEAHSERRLFTGFAKAALIAWKLIVNNAIIADMIPATANNHQGIFVL